MILTPGASKNLYASVLLGGRFVKHVALSAAVVLSVQVLHAPTPISREYTAPTAFTPATHAGLLTPLLKPVLPDAT